MSTRAKRELYGTTRYDRHYPVSAALYYVGPAGAQAFMEAKRLAGGYAADMAMGVAMAFTARLKDQSLLPDTREAIMSLWDRTPEALAERVEALRQSFPSSALADGTACAAWRADIARDFAG